MAVGLGSMDMPVPAVAEWEWLNWKFPRPVRAGETIYARCDRPRAGVASDTGGRRRAHRDSGLAGGCAYHRRSAVRRGRRWGERDAKGDWDPQSACRGGRNPRRGDCRASQAAPPPHSRGRRSQERLRNQGRARGGGAIRGDPGSCGGFRAGCEWYETPASSPFPRLGAGSKRRYARAGGSARSLELP